MKEISLSRRATLAGLVSTALPFGGALAAFPDKAIKWIVAYAPGGGTDTLARLVGQEMSAKLSRPVVIENRPGGATNIGAGAAAKADPDGHTVFTADNGTLVFNTALFRQLPYNPERDFREVGLMARFPLILAVKKTSVSTSARDLIDRARAEPGKIDCGSPGVGSPHHLAMERLGREAGVRFNHIPYKGGAPGVGDLAAGHIESMIIDLPTGASHLRAGNIRPLALCSATRLDSLPELPTVQESLDLTGFEASAWQGLVVPKATPDAAVERLSSELAAALSQEAVLAKMRDIGLEPLTGGPAEMKRLTEAERAVWVPLIRSLGITLD
jgi:tripartite-type tricarboxylate transporter receptor subunit TctC